MGAKTWMLVYADGSARSALAAHPVLDRVATAQLATRLFPGERLEEREDGDLSNTCPPNDEILIGCFTGVSVIAAKEFSIDKPSKLPERFIKAGGNGIVQLHAMHSAVDWFAYAQWKDGNLQRSLSLSPDNGVVEDVGKRMAFEEPYWAGAHPAIDKDEDPSGYPFPFHPLDLGEAALSNLFGYQLEGSIDGTLLEPDAIPLMRYKRIRSWWKFLK